MRSIIALLAGLLLSASLTHAQPGGPVGPAPAFKIVSSVDKAKGHLVFVETITRAVPVTVEKVVVVNGQKMTVTVTEYRTEAVQISQVIDVGASRVITPDGKQVPIDEVWTRVKAKSVVVVSSDSRTPAQAYLRALNAETLVIIPGQPKKN